MTLPSSQEQLDFLRDRGCDEYQGYLFSQGVPPDAFIALLSNAREFPPTTTRAQSLELILTP